MREIIFLCINHQAMYHQALMHIFSWSIKKEIPAFYPRDSTSVGVE